MIAFKHSDYSGMVRQILGGYKGPGIDWSHDIILRPVGALYDGGIIHMGIGSYYIPIG